MIESKPEELLYNLLIYVFPCVLWGNRLTPAAKCEMDLMKYLNTDLYNTPPNTHTF